VDALLVRAAAAHELVDAGLLDGILALSYVVFSSEGRARRDSLTISQRMRHQRGEKMTGGRLTGGNRMIRAR
jgi:hypothetical protein